MSTIDDIASAMKNGGNIPSIHTFTYGGRTFILNGHHRVKGAIKANKSLDMMDFSLNKARSLYPDKVEQILNGLF